MPGEEPRHPGKERTTPGRSLFSPALLTSSKGCCGVPGQPAAQLTGGTGEQGRQAAQGGGSEKWLCLTAAWAMPAAVGTGEEGAA